MNARQLKFYDKIFFITYRQIAYLYGTTHTHRTNNISICHMVTSAPGAGIYGRNK